MGPATNLCDSFLYVFTFLAVVCIFHALVFGQSETGGLWSVALTKSHTHITNHALHHQATTNLLAQALADKDEERSQTVVVRVRGWIDREDGWMCIPPNSHGCPLLDPTVSKRPYTHKYTTVPGPRHLDGGRHGGPGADRALWEADARADDRRGRATASAGVPEGGSVFISSLRERPACWTTEDTNHPNDTDALTRQ